MVKQLERAVEDESDGLYMTYGSFPLSHVKFNENIAAIYTSILSETNKSYFKLKSYSQRKKTKICEYITHKKERYIQLTWKNVLFYGSPKQKNGFNQIRIKIFNHIKVLLIDAGFEVSAVGTTPDNRLPYYSDIDINISKETGNGDKTKITMEEINKATSTDQDNNFDKMFDINMYPYQKYDSNTDTYTKGIAHTRIANIVEMEGLHDIFEHEQMGQITKKSEYETAEPERKSIGTLSSMDRGLSIYAESLKDVYYSIGSVLHIVDKRKDLEPSMYIDSLVDNFGFLLQSLFEKSSCHDELLYMRLARSCKYIGRMCEATELYIKVDQKTSVPIINLEMLKEDANRVNESRKGNYMLLTEDSLQDQLKRVYKHLLTNTMDNDKPYKEIDPIAGYTYEINWVYIILQHFKTYLALYQVGESGGGVNKKGVFIRKQYINGRNHNIYRFGRKHFIKIRGDMIPLTSYTKFVNRLKKRSSRW
jgi:hypothetical protein